jgi:hypothetical protein
MLTSFSSGQVSLGVKSNNVAAGDDWAHSLKLFNKIIFSNLIFHINEFFSRFSAWIMVKKYSLIQLQMNFWASCLLFNHWYAICWLLLTGERDPR